MVGDLWSYPRRSNRESLPRESHTPIGNQFEMENLMSQPVSRRQFLGTSGKTAAGVAAASAIHTMIRDAKAADANSRYNVALIGCGGMGRRKLQNFLDSDMVNLVALCDVDPNQI